MQRGRRSLLDDAASSLLARLGAAMERPQPHKVGPLTERVAAQAVQRAAQHVGMQIHATSCPQMKKATLFGNKWPQVPVCSPKSGRGRIRTCDPIDVSDVR
jgi:hypothetical protein